MNVEMLRRRIARGIDAAPDEATVLRAGRNAFNERESWEVVAKIRGQHYRGGYFWGRNAYANKTTRISGRTINRNAEKFMAVANTACEAARVGDFFEIRGQRFEVVDLFFFEGVLYDFSLERR